MDFHGMKRKGLQALCKKHGIPANLTNREMADRLALLLKENEKPMTKGQSGLKNLGDTEGEIDSVIVTEKVIKKVRFSPENQTFIFVSSDTESSSDHNYNPKKRLRKRKSMSKLESTKQVVRDKNVKKAETSAKIMDSKLRVTRSRVQRVVGTDAEMVFFPPATKNRGRGRRENVDVCDKPPPIADLVDKDDGYEASAKSRGGLIKRQLRSTDVVIEADEKACDGELAPLRENSILKASKKTRNVKASDGVVLVDQIFEDNVLAGEAAKPEKVPKRSKGNLSKGKGCNSLNEDLDEIGIGRRSSRSRKVDGKDFAVECESGIHEVQIENQKALQLEEPVKGLGKNISRCKSNGRVQNEILALECIERGQLVKGSRKRSIPNGPLRRSQRHTASLSFAATAGGELRTQENVGSMKLSKKGPPEADANVAQPSKQSSWNASRNFSVVNSKEVVGTADGVRKDLQMKQCEEQISAEESSISVHEPVTNKPLRRSSRNVSKSKIVEVTNRKDRAAAKNKQSKARMKIVVEEGSLGKSSLPLDSDFYCEKKVKEMSVKKRKGFKRKSVAISQLGSADVSALNSGKKGSKQKSVAISQLVSAELSALNSGKKGSKRKSVPISQLGSAEVSGLNSGKKGFKRKSIAISLLGSTEVTALNSGKSGATCTTSDLADQVYASAELQGVSIFQEKRDSISEVVFNEKESIIEEEQKEILFMDNKEDMDDQSCHSFNPRGESGDGKWFEQENAEPVAYSIKINNVVSCGFISPVNEYAGLKIEESSMEKHINPCNDKVDDLSADSKTDVQGHQNLLELDANGNFDSVQEETVRDDHLSELGGSCESERSSEKFFNEAEKLHGLVPCDINGITQIDVDATGTAGSGADTHLEIINWGDTTTSPFTMEEESEEAFNNGIVSAVEKVVCEGFEENLMLGGRTFQELDLKDGQATVEKKQEVSDGCLDNVSQEAKTKYMDKIDDDIIDSRTTQEERGIDVDKYVLQLENGYPLLSEREKFINFHEVVDAADEKAIEASVIICSDREIEKHAVEEEEPGVLPHLTWEKFQYQECESPGSSKEVVPVDCKTEASNEIQTALLMDQIKCDDLHIDISDPGAADRLMPMNDEDNIEDSDGKDDDDLNSKDDCSEIEKEYNLDAVTELNLEKMDDYLVNEGVTDVNDTEASLEICSYHDIEKYATEEVDQGSLSSLMSEKLPLQKECEYRGASDEVVPVDCKKEASNEIQTALQMDQANFAGLHIDISDRSAADHLMPLDNEDNDGKEDGDLNSKDGFSKTKKEDNLDGTTDVTLKNVGGVTDANDGNGVFLLNVANEYVRAVPVAADMECIYEISTSKSINNDSKWISENSAEVKLSPDATCDQPETFSSRSIGSVVRISSLGDECGSNKPSEGNRNGTIEKEAVVDDREEDTTQRESRFLKNNGDLSDTREDVNVDNNATCQESAEELLDDINGGVRDSAFMNGNEGMISNKPSNGNGSEYNAKVAEQVLGSPALVEMPVHFSLPPVSATAYFDGFVVENNARTSLEAVNEQLDGHGNVLTETGLLYSDDRLDLNHLFDSNSTRCKSNSKETGEETGVKDLENVAVSSGESKNLMDCGKNVSTKNHEMNVECSAVSPVTASFRHENKAVEYDAELALFTSCELNVFAEDWKRDKFDDINLRTSNATLISEAHEVNEGREIDASIVNVLTEGHCDHEHSMVEEVKKLKLNHLVASDEPSGENGEPKEQGSVPVITQELVDCERHKPECVEFENPIEATVFDSSNFAASDKPTANCCATELKLLENHVKPAGDGKHEHHIDTSISGKLIPGGGESSTTIQENIGCETLMDELVDGKNSYTSMCKLRTAGAADINGYDCATVEDAQEDSIAKPGLEKMFPDRENKAHAMTSGTADMEEIENGAPVLPLNSMGDDTTLTKHGIEFSKISDAAPGASNEIMSSDYEDQGRPNDTIQATTQVREPKFGSLQKQREVFSYPDKSASISSDSCLFWDGKAANKEENVGKAVGHLNAHVIFYDESNDNVDGVLEVTAGDVNDHYVEKQLLERNDNGPGPLLVNSHEINIYTNDEGGDESSDGRIGFENVEDSTKLLGKQLISPCRLNNCCLWGEKSAYVKSFADTPSGRTVSGSGKEYECHPYRSCTRNDSEATEMANEDTGFDHEKMDPVRGDSEPGNDKTVEGQNGNKGINDGAYGFAVETIARTSLEAVNKQLDGDRDVLKETGLPDSNDRLDLTNLFDSISTGSKSKSKVTGEELDLQDLENMAISSGESKDFLDFEKNVSTMKHELNVECSAVTASRPEVGKRDEFEEVNTRTLNTTSTSETHEGNKVGEIDASIAKVVIEEHCDREPNMVEEVEKLKHTHLTASDEPSCENEGAGTKEQGGVSVITQELVHCQHHKSESVEFQNSIETTEINGNKFAASDKATAECCATDSKLLENHENPTDEAVASESIQALQPKLKTHSHQENSLEAKLLRNISYSAMPIRKSNKDCLIPRTPKSLRKIHDMKENFLNAKREQVENITATKTLVKRRALGDLQKD
ncbi:hypothetical protein FNV43_RR10667 [Rhamnella rubrinervis]|uniref:Uncharacterized protein n=1 Tax=Rhamnella rubrinervis TaxID=2594499 RepID=A0A8K0MGX7_9ROSA|nr:hypothetical protein FNV43_RR10667 [Rhamnella rubrinervis]